MKAPEIPKNEIERLEALYSYQILDDDQKEELDEITRLAANICETPISLITLVDSTIQWHKAKYGEMEAFIPREISFCAHAINHPDQDMIIEDVKSNPTFHDNPMVLGDPHIAFYAGIPLNNPDGLTLGTLCVIDRKSRKLNEFQLEALHSLSNQIMRLFELHKTVREMKDKEEQLEMSIKSLEEYTAFIAHDLRNPFRNIELITEVLMNNHTDELSHTSKAYLSDIIQESKESRAFINNLLTYSKSIHAFNQDSEIVDLKILFAKIIQKLLPPDRFKISISKYLPQVFYPRIALIHVFKNILENNLKYNENLNPTISIDYEENEDEHIISISDNGNGIEAELHDIIFKLFSGDLESDGKFIKSIGVGLAIVNKLVSLMDGSVKVISSKGNGSTFVVTLPKTTEIHD